MRYPFLKMLYERLKETTHNLTYSGNKEQTEKHDRQFYSPAD